MNNILFVNPLTANDVALAVASRIKERRLELDLTQQGLAARADIPFATYRRFEQTGQISFGGLLQIAYALNVLSDFETLFAQKQYQSIDDMLNKIENKHKRGRKNG